MRIKPIFFVIVILISGYWGTSAYGAWNEIGFYFDESHSINCLPDSVNMGFPITGYLVLKNCSASGGVAGWEGAFSLSQGMHIINVSYSVDAINIGTFPEYVVGFDEPIPWSESIVLATVGLLIMSPGEIFFHSVEEASLEGALAPVYLDGNDPGYLVPMNYSYGDQFNAVATIGIQSCPQDSVFQEPLTQGYLELIPGVGEVGFREEVVNSNSMNKAIVPDWEDQWLSRDLGVRGSVREIEFGCYSAARGDHGVVRLSIVPEEVFWGAELAIYEIWIKGVELPDCVKYGQNARFDSITEVDIGDEVLVFAFLKEDILWSTKRDFFSNDQLEKLSKNDSGLGDLKSVAAQNEIPNLFSQSDAVVVLEFDASEISQPPYYRFNIVEVFVGREYVEPPFLNIRHHAGFSQLVGGENIELRMLCFLTRLDDGNFELTHNYKSVYLQKDGGFYSVSGMPIDISGMSK